MKREKNFFHFKNKNNNSYCKFDIEDNHMLFGMENKVSGIKFIFVFFSFFVFVLMKAHFHLSYIYIKKMTDTLLLLSYMNFQTSQDLWLFILFWILFFVSVFDKISIYNQKKSEFIELMEKK